MAIAWLMNMDFAAGEGAAPPIPDISVDPLIRPGELFVKEYVRPGDNVLQTNLTLKKDPRSYSDP